MMVIIWRSLVNGLDVDPLYCTLKPLIDALKGDNDLDPYSGASSFQHESTEHSTTDHIAQAEIVANNLKGSSKLSSQEVCPAIEACFHCCRVSRGAL